MNFTFDLSFSLILILKNSFISRTAQRIILKLENILWNCILHIRLSVYKKQTNKYISKVGRFCQFYVQLLISTSKSKRGLRFHDCLFSIPLFFHTCGISCILCQELSFLCSNNSVRISCLMSAGRARNSGLLISTECKSAYRNLDSASSGLKFVNINWMQVYILKSGLCVFGSEIC